MNNIIKVFQLFKQLNSNRKLPIIILIIFILIAAGLDSISMIGMFLFMKYFVSQGGAGAIEFVIGQVSISVNESYVIVCFLIVAIAPIMRFFLQSYIIDYGHKLAHNLSKMLYITHMRKNLIDSLSITSSELNAAILNKTNLVTHGAIMPAVQIAANIFIIIGITCGLFIIDLNITLYALIIIFSFYGSIYFFSKKILVKLSVIINKNLNHCATYITEGLDEKKYLINNIQIEKFVLNFTKYDLRLRLALSKMNKISIFPRYGLESFVLLIITLIFAYASVDVSNSIPLLGAFALAAQRLLPLVQNIFASLSAINSSSASVEELNELIKRQPLESKENVIPSIIHKINVKDLRLGYDNREMFNIPNFEINPGDIIAIIGPSGVGKSILLNFLSGLLRPVDGKLFINDKETNIFNEKEWFIKTTSVNQLNTLLNLSIFELVNYHCLPENNVFKFDKKRYNHCMEVSQCSEFVENLPDKDNYIVGEKSFSISGGQRQRLAIARALNRDYQVLLMDEPTSALDAGTSDKFFESLLKISSDKIVIFTTHQKDFLKYANKVIDLENGTTFCDG